MNVLNDNFFRVKINENTKTEFDINEQIWKKNQNLINESI